MDIQTRKIEFVQEFLKLTSEDAILRLEQQLRKERKRNTFSQMTVGDLNRRIDASMVDSENDKVIEANDLMAEIEKWP